MSVRNETNGGARDAATEDARRRRAATRAMDASRDAFIARMMGVERKRRIT